MPELQPPPALKHSTSQLSYITSRGDYLAPYASTTVSECLPTHQQFWQPNHPAPLSFILRPSLPPVVDHLLYANTASDQSMETVKAWEWDTALHVRESHAGVTLEILGLVRSIQNQTKRYQCILLLCNYTIILDTKFFWSTMCNQSNLL